MRKKPIAYNYNKYKGNPERLEDLYKSGGFVWGRIYRKDENNDKT